MKKNNNIVQIPSTEFSKFIHGTPEIVSRVVYNLMAQKENRIPRFDSVFKVVKEELKYSGYDYKLNLSDGQRYDLEDIARDAYDGIREAGF